MPFLRAPYWRRTWIDASYIPYTPSEYSTGLTGIETSVGQGFMVPYYDDETPSELTIYAVDQVVGGPYDDGNLYLSWQDNTGGLRSHRLLFRPTNVGGFSSVSWQVSAQYAPSRTTGVIGNFIQVGSYDAAVQSIDTADNFLSQVTYVNYTFV